MSAIEEIEEMTVLIVATGNPGKLRELQGLLTDSGWELRLKPDNLEIEETGTTFAENACIKASQVAKATQQWVIADDSGLEVAALGGAPGVFSARYGQTDGERIARLLDEMGQILDRTARFVCVISVARPDGTIALQAEGICSGSILTAPRGSGGFGYDPVFCVSEDNLTFAEMPAERKRVVSHRGRALAKLLPALQALRDNR